jgi:all-trans-8'-apo-beta-carotenal 15,15'-oxygenase
MTSRPVVPTAGADWSIAVASVEVEHAGPVALEATGDLPSGLTGTLYLVGPARHDVHGSRTGSLLDGDGMAHAIRLGANDADGADGGSTATYQSRYIDTARKRAEDKAGRRLYATFAAPAPGGRLARLARSKPKSPANAGVLVHQGRLFALWDGAPPYELDPATLATIGPYRLGRLLDPTDGFASSPVTDPETGDVWNIGGLPRTWPMRTRLGLYRWPVDGPPQRVGVGTLPYRSFVRSLALTRTKAVFLLSPLVAVASARGLLGQRPMAEMLDWQPDLGARIGVVDRATGRFTFHAAPPLLAAGLAQAFDDGADLVIDLCTYPNPSMLGAATDVIKGGRTATGYATLERLVLRPRDEDKPVERILLPPLDWPTLAAPPRPGPDARIFGLNLNPVAGFPGTIAAVDVGTRRVQYVPPLPDEVAGPPTAVAKAKANGAWVLTVVTNFTAKTSELRVYDGDDLKAPPAYRAALPSVVPFGARGAWAAPGSPARTTSA